MPTNNEVRAILVPQIRDSLEATDGRLSAAHAQVNEMDVKKNDLLFILPANDEEADPATAGSVNSLLEKADLLSSLIQSL